MAGVAFRSVDEVIEGLALDGNRLTAVGYTMGGLFGPDGVESDGFVLRLRDTGVVIASEQFDSGSYDQAHGVSVDAAGF